MKHALWIAFLTVGCARADDVVIDGLDNRQIREVLEYGGAGADTIDAAAIAPNGTRLLVVRHRNALSFGRRSVAEGAGTAIFAHQADRLMFVLNTDTSLAVVRAAPVPGGGWVVSAGFFGRFERLNAPPIESSGMHDSVVLRISDVGHVLWTKHFGAGGDVFVNALRADVLGNIYAAGRFAETLHIDDQTHTARTGDDTFIAKLDPNGSIEWLRTISSESSDTIGAAAITRAEGLVIAGRFTGSLTLDDIVLEAPRSAYVASMDPDGRFTHARVLGGADTEFTAIAIEREHGDIVLGGTFTGRFEFGEISLVSRGQTDIVVARVDRLLRFDRAQRYGGDLLDVIEDLTIDRYGWTWFVGSVRGTSLAFGSETADDGSTDAVILGQSRQGAPRFFLRLGGPGEQVGAVIGVEETGVIDVIGLFQGALPLMPTKTPDGKFSVFGIRLVAF